MDSRAAELVTTAREVLYLMGGPLNVESFLGLEDLG
jgi:hypothetical protein